MNYSEKQENQMSVNKKGTFNQQILRSLLPMILITAVLPYVIYRLASPHMADLPALLLAGIPPVVFTVTDFVRRHQLNLLATMALLAIVIKLISALFFKDIHLVLISDSLLTGVYGLIMLGSLLFGKPILLLLFTSMLKDGPAEQREQMQQRSQSSGHSFFTILTALWGVGLSGSFVLSVALAYTMPVPHFLAISPLIQYGIFGGLILVSHAYGTIRRHQKSRQGAQIQSVNEAPTIHA